MPDDAELPERGHLRRQEGEPTRQRRCPSRTRVAASRSLGPPRGVCRAVGTLVCSPEAGPPGFEPVGPVCNAVPGAEPSRELCNGLDDDCDGEVDDEAARVGDACGCVVGVCEAGVQACLEGELVCVGYAEPEPEECNGLDDDCDGEVDEGELCPDGEECDDGECGTGCSDDLEPNDDPLGARDVAPGLYEDLCVELGDDDWFFVALPPHTRLEVALDFLHSHADVDVTLQDDRGMTRTGSTSVSNHESLSWETQADPFAAFVRVYVYSHSLGHQADYTMTVVVDALECVDGDGDGFGAHCAAGPDCDDQVPEVHPGAPELCNGRDDDCDGEVDQGLGVGLPCSAGEGICRVEGVLGCDPAGSGATVCEAPPQPPPLPEVCNDLDDDCNGIVDDDVIDAGDPCGSSSVGVCTLGLEVCRGGALVCEGAIDPEPEACNGLDDDCDGVADDDEDLCPDGEDCVEGACEPAPTCHDAFEDNDRREEAVPAPPGLHGALCVEPDDADWFVLEVPPDTLLEVGVLTQLEPEPGVDARVELESAAGGSLGSSPLPARLTWETFEAAAMLRLGVLMDVDPFEDPPGLLDYALEVVVTPLPCVDADGDGFGDHCDAGRDCDDGDPEVFPGQSEVCNDVDDDCDGEVDEDFLVGEPCRVGEGICQADGVIRCLPWELPAGDFVMAYCDAVRRVEPTVEICNGLDDDCDGEVDDDPVEAGALCGDDEGECEPGREVCQGGVLVCEGGVMPVPEACNDLDDNCDGATDETFPLGEVCEVGVGACLREGLLECTGPDEVGCSAVPGEPEPERCDLLDRNCNGEVGEALVDEDGDGYMACEDCDDTDPRRSPGVLDLPDDGVDNDCDGEADGPRVCAVLLHRFDGTEEGEGVGTAAASAGDLDLDGHDDLVVGAPGLMRAWVLSGFDGRPLFPAPLQASDAPDLGPGECDGFGAAVGGAGDMDGDGVADVFVGCGAAGSRAYVYSGATGALLFTVQGAAGTGFGSAVAGAGDLDGDGGYEIVVGAPGGGQGTGAVSVFGDGGGLLLGLEGDPDSAAYGTAVGGVGDVDGDGRGDLLIGSPAAAYRGRPDAGSAFVYSLKACLP